MSFNTSTLHRVPFLSLGFHPVEEIGCTSSSSPLTNFGLSIKLGLTFCNQGLSKLMKRFMPNKSMGASGQSHVQYWPISRLIHSRPSLVGSDLISGKNFDKWIKNVKSWSNRRWIVLSFMNSFIKSSNLFFIHSSATKCKYSQWLWYSVDWKSITHWVEISQRRFWEGIRQPGLQTTVF